MDDDEAERMRRDRGERVASRPMVIRQWLSEHPEALVLLAASVLALGYGMLFQSEARCDLQLLQTQGEALQRSAQAVVSQVAELMREGE